VAALILRTQDLALDSLSEVLMKQTDGSGGTTAVIIRNRPSGFDRSRSHRWLVDPPAKPAALSKTSAQSTRRARSEALTVMTLIRSEFRVPSIIRALATARKIAD
jgi:hypothetical protein